MSFISTRDDMKEEDRVPRPFPGDCTRVCRLGDSKKHHSVEATVTDLKHVTIYTDGACLGNPGPGGYGVVLLHGSNRKELSKGFRRTTNNRMELLAAIAGVEVLKNACRVTLYSDSQYLVNAMENGWAERWRKNGWRRNKQEAALNPDLWDRLLGLCEIHRVKFQWVRGHAGTPENERCDELAQAAARGADLAIDQVYERGMGT
jgi:ribonuclease HI